MEMQFNTLLFRGILTAFRLGNFIDSVRLQNHFAVKAVQIESALYLEALTNLHRVHDGFGLFSFHELVNANGVGVIGHVEADYPGFPLGQFLVLHVEHGAFHQNAAHIQLKFIHRHRLFLIIDLTVDLFDFALLLMGLRVLCTHDLTAHSFHLGKDIIRLFRLLDRFRDRIRFCNHRSFHRDLSSIQTEGLNEGVLCFFQQLRRHLRADGANQHGPLGLDHAHLHRICTQNSQNPFREGAFGKGLLKGRQSDALHMYTLLAYRVSINFISSGTS